MFFTNVINTIQGRAHQATHKASAHSPEIALVGGLVALTGAAVILARAHRKAEPLPYIRDEALEAVEDEIDAFQANSGVVLTQEQRMRATAPIHAGYVIENIKLYGPPILLGTAGVVLILAGHRIQTKRIQQLGSALVLVQQAFAQYRKRVVEELGEEADERFMWGFTPQTIKKLIVGEDGKKRKEERVENIEGENFSPSMYNRVYDDRVRTWRPSEAISEGILRGVEQSLNDRLRLKGWVSLNELYDALGYEEQPYGQVMGWSTSLPGTAWIDLGLDTPYNNREIAPGEHRTWLLSPNVQGLILDHIGN